MKKQPPKVLGFTTWYMESGSRVIREFHVVQIKDGKVYGKYGEWNRLEDTYLTSAQCAQAHGMPESEHRGKAMAACVSAEQLLKRALRAIKKTVAELEDKQP